MKLFLKILLGLIAFVILLAVIGWFALQRPDTPYETLEAAYASPASQYMDLGDGLRVHYRDEGSRTGPVIVLVHGFSASLHTWEPWVQRLAPDYRVITLDLPGHGLTRAPEGYQASMDRYAEVVDQVTSRLGLQGFVLGGNSMGGHVSWLYALKHPEKLTALVLVNSAGWPDGAGDEEEPIVFKVLASPVGRALVGRMDSTQMIRGGLRAAFEPTPDMVDDAMLTRYVQMARAPGHRDIIFSLMTGERPLATPEKLAAIQVPTLILHGDTDKLIHVAAGRQFDAAIPDSTLIVYENVGHIPMEQIPDRSANDLQAWLDSKVFARTAESPEPAP
ncbi:MAG TPA: alpha/beta hydrolase [Caulobacteraceae bacterium]|nr:alpha/beta hydrolase [Caulobacteraceae bacterium]